MLDPAVGRYGTDYDLRALVGILGLGANTPEEAIYPTALADSEGRLLDGANSTGSFSTNRPLRARSGR